jgi:hypothetical protein
VAHVTSPWTRQQVDHLAAWQHSQLVRPVECRIDHTHLLVATVRGWICTYDDFTQNWAEDFMTAGLLLSEMTTWVRRAREQTDRSIERYRMRVQSRSLGWEELVRTRRPFSESD